MRRNFPNPRRPNMDFCSNELEAANAPGTSTDHLLAAAAAAKTPEEKAAIENLRESLMPEVDADGLPEWIEPNDDGTFYCAPCDQELQTRSGTVKHAAGESHQKKVEELDSE